MQVASRYNTPAEFWKSRFPGKIQKVSLNTGFTCPNRDGSKGYGGCTYCNNNSFNPDYCEPTKTIHNQLDEGIRFFSRKYKDMQYLAYFQAYTNSYAADDTVIRLYEEAVSHPQIIGLVVGTRPDCVSDRVLDYLGSLNKRMFVGLEFGVESTLNKTLEFINRCHTFEETIEAYDRAAGRGLHLGAHMILGLPHESQDEMVAHADRLSQLPIHAVKLHHLQIIRKTIMEKQYKLHPEWFPAFTPESYVELVVDFLERLRPDITVERFMAQAPPGLLVAPQWGGLKNHEMISRVEKHLEARDTFQGKLYHPQTRS
ncbi:MAG: TIGR01212 family radical SAM protein [Flavobacteriales bacterium]|nr:TIGR01212 family radical SAM protein [Flavobacteriales bacterium]MCB9448107.1 TIGR01212 family radical SAM protein [Flavobacteriales bacterium]